MIAKLIRDFLPEGDLLAYLEAIMRVYNLLWPPRQQVQGAHQDPGARDRHRRIAHGRSRTNSTRIRRWRAARCRRPTSTRIKAYFAPPALRDRAGKRAQRSTPRAAKGATPISPAGLRSNVAAHKQPGYAIVTMSLKPIGGARAMPPTRRWMWWRTLPSDISHDEIRVSHEQNLILPHVAMDDLPARLRRACRGKGSPPPMPA